jgi:hypothetical protein
MFTLDTLCYEEIYLSRYSTTERMIESIATIVERMAAGYNTTLEDYLIGPEWAIDEDCKEFRVAGNRDYYNVHYVTFNEGGTGFFRYEVGSFPMISYERLDFTWRVGKYSRCYDCETIDEDVSHDDCNQNEVFRNYLMMITGGSDEELPYTISSWHNDKFSTAEKHGWDPQDGSKPIFEVIRFSYHRNPRPGHNWNVFDALVDSFIGAVDGYMSLEDDDSTKIMIDMGIAGLWNIAGESADDVLGAFRQERADVVKHFGDTYYCNSTVPFTYNPITGLWDKCNDFECRCRNQ